jgi:hypothetical protein
VGSALSIALAEKAQEKITASINRNQEGLEPETNSAPRARDFSLNHCIFGQRLVFVSLRDIFGSSPCEVNKDAKELHLLGAIDSKPVRS